MRTLLLLSTLLALNSDVYSQRVIEMNIDDSLYFNNWTISPKTAKGLTISSARLKDSLSDGVYKAYRCYSGCKRGEDKVPFLEATYVNGVRHGREIYYGHVYGSEPHLASITLTEYKYGLVDGMFIDAKINAENTVSIEAMKQYKIGKQNGISIYSPSGLIREVLLYRNDEVIDTLWKINDSVNNIWYLMEKQPYFSGEYLQGILLKEQKKTKSEKLR
jgi:hypothetical protein